MRKWLVEAALLFSSRPLLAQSSGSPVADALRLYLTQFSKNLQLAVDDFPVAKFNYKPTSPQLSVATIVEHLAGSNNFLCASVAGVTPPASAQIQPDNTPPDSLKAHLKKSFEFCQTSLANLNDSKLADSVPFFGGKRTRAAVILALPYDWADHYSQMANYLRLNAISPPNAKARAVPVK